MEVIMPKFSERLRELRNGKRYKQKEMAELLKCTLGHYQKIEAGKINIPTLTLVELADFFGVSTDYLLGRTDRREPTAAKENPSHAG